MLRLILWADVHAEMKAHYALPLAMRRAYSTAAPLHVAQNPFHHALVLWHFLVCIFMSLLIFRSYTGTYASVFRNRKSCVSSVRSPSSPDKPVFGMASSSMSAIFDLALDQAHVSPTNVADFRMLSTGWPCTLKHFVLQTLYRRNQADCERFHRVGG